LFVKKKENNVIYNNRKYYLQLPTKLKLVDVVVRVPINAGNSVNSAGGSLGKKKQQQNSRSIEQRNHTNV
jgi:hypothetical protein